MGDVLVLGKTTDVGDKIYAILAPFLCRENLRIIFLWNNFTGRFLLFYTVLTRIACEGEAPADPDVTGAAAERTSDLGWCISSSLQMRRIRFR